MNTEEINDALNSKIRDRDKLIISLDNVSKELAELLEQKYSLDPKMVRIKCINCGGVGYSVGEDSKKRICQMCNGKLYNWTEIFIEKK